MTTAHAIQVEVPPIKHAKKTQIRLQLATEVLVCGCGHDEHDHGDNGQRMCTVEGCRCSYFLWDRLVPAAQREKWACSCDRNDTNLECYHTKWCPRGGKPHWQQ